MPILLTATCFRSACRTPTAELAREHAKSTRGGSQGAKSSLSTGARNKLEMHGVGLGRLTRHSSRASNNHSCAVLCDYFCQELPLQGYLAKHPKLSQEWRIPVRTQALSHARVSFHAGVQPCIGQQQHSVTRQASCVEKACAASQVACVACSFP